MARMPLVFRLLAVWTLTALIAGSDAPWAISAELGGRASETPLPPWPSTSTAYQPPVTSRPADSGVVPAVSTATNAFVQPTSYVAGPLSQASATPSTASASTPPTPPAATPSNATPSKGTLLPPPSRRIDPAQAQAPGQSGAARSGAPASLLTLVGSLAVVIALFLAAAWLLRRTTGGRVPALPKEVVEVLGRAPLAGRQQVHMLRVGRKLILVAVSQAGMETLTEITEAVEVDRLAGLCQQIRPDSATTVFRNVLEQVGVQSAARRRPPADDVRLANLTVPQFADEYQESRHA